VRLCVFVDNQCEACGAPKLNASQLCGTWKASAGELPTPSNGPGTELSKLLKRFGINPTPTCSCRAKAAQMDAWGPDECSRPERIEEVVAVMRAEAAARGLPFVDMVGRLLVRRAIKNARKSHVDP
jgi:hypothetical protein